MEPQIAVAVRLFPDLIRVLAGDGNRVVKDRIIGAVKNATGTVDPAQAETKIEADDQTKFRLVNDLAQIYLDETRESNRVNEEARRIELERYRMDAEERERIRAEDFRRQMLDFQDRQLARSPQMMLEEKHNLLAWVAPILAFLLVAMIWYLLHGIMTAREAVINKDVLNVVLGALVTAFTTVVAYYFGSSLSSSKKDAAIRSGRLITNNKIAADNIGDAADDAGRDAQRARETDDRSNQWWPSAPPAPAGGAVAYPSQPEPAVAAYPPQPAPARAAYPPQPAPAVYPDYPAYPPPPRPIQEDQVIDFLYATNRRPSFDDSYYSGERSETVSYGTASVRVPELHRMGKLERPFKLSLLGLTFFEESLNSHKHFIIQNIDVRTSDDWRKLITSSDRDRALVFVHGFNTNFRDAALRSAQIFWDLQYSGIPVLFSWPSRGAVIDYLYDRDSALCSRDAFIATLRDIRSAGTRRIDILAHSMGNLVILEAIAAHAFKEELGITEVLLAAPDIDKDHYKSIATKVRTAVSGITLYASSADRALATSRRIAGNIARAGDVPDEGPVTVQGIDAIDVTAIGSELFGLGHGPFASARSILDDIGLVISTGTRPPNRRLVQIRGMPSGDPIPKWWRYTY